MYFIEFLRAVWDTWVEKVGIILTVLAFIEKIPRVKLWLNEKPIIDRFVPVLWAAGGVCIIWGFYSAWRTQYEKTLPRLTLHIEGTTIGAYPDAPNDTTFLL